MLESDIQKQVIQYCRSFHKNDFFVMGISNEAIFKMVGKQSVRMRVFGQLSAMGFVRGFPDLIFIKAGRILLIEMKAEKGRLNDNQKTLFPILEKFSGPIKICRSLDDVLVVLKEEEFIK